MNRFISSTTVMLLFVSSLSAQTGPSYSKDIRPFLAKYCVECHNAKALKGTLNLDSYKAMMDGSDSNPVVKAGKPDESKLVTLAEHKDKPTMPPPKAKFQPTKDEVKLLRAWVLAGAKDDGVSVKVELPVIKVRIPKAAPVTGLGYSIKSKTLFVAQLNWIAYYRFPLDKNFNEGYQYPWNVSALTVGKAFDCTVGVTEADGKSSVAMPGLTGWVPIDVRVLGTILDITYDQSEKKLAASTYEGKIHLRLGEAVHHTLKEHSDTVYGLAFNPDGTLLASVSADRAMKIWDVEKGKLLYTLGEATDWLYTVAWSPNGKYLVSGGVDKSLRVYEPTATGAKLRQSVFAHEGPVQKVLFSTDSKTLYSVGQDRVIKAWDVEKMVERKVYDKQPETVLCMALREDAGQIIIGRYDGVVQLIDMKSGKIAHEFGKEKAPAKPRDERSDSRGAQRPEFILQKDTKENTIQSNDPPGQSPGTGSMIKLPTNIAGALDRAGAVHFYQFEITDKDQQLGIRVQSKDTKSKIDPVLILSDMTGRVLAESKDGLIGHTFSAKGKYAVAVRDREFRGGADFKYQLELGEIPIITEVFPMGLQRGSGAAIEVQGVFLSQAWGDVRASKDAKIGDLVSVPIVGAKFGKTQVVVGEFPEVKKSARCPSPAPRMAASRRTISKTRGPSAPGKASVSSSKSTLAASAAGSIRSSRFSTRRISPCRAPSCVRRRRRTSRFAITIPRRATFASRRGAN